MKIHNLSKTSAKFLTTENWLTRSGTYHSYGYKLVGLLGAWAVVAAGATTALAVPAALAAPSQSGTQIAPVAASIGDRSVEEIIADLPDDLSQFVSSYSGEVWQYSGEVVSVDTRERDGDEQVIILESDILFDKDKWELPPSAARIIGEILADVPQGATLAVQGHTDSVQGEVDNGELSENRAQAVAAAIGEVRSDLNLKVAGFGATKPKEAERGSDIEAARQANRRVELRYEG